MYSPFDFKLTRLSSFFLQRRGENRGSTPSPSFFNPCVFICLEGKESLGIGSPRDVTLLGIGPDLLKRVSPHFYHMICNLSSERNRIDRIKPGKLLQSRKLGPKGISFREG